MTVWVFLVCIEGGITCQTAGEQLWTGGFWDYATHIRIFDVQFCANIRPLVCVPVR